MLMNTFSWSTQEHHAQGNGEVFLRDMSCLIACSLLSWLTPSFWRRC